MNNNRGDMVRLLIEYCDNLGLSYSYTEKLFKVKLPEREELPTITHLNPRNGRKTFDTDSWGEKGIDEDELPPIDKPLNEGETPEETK